MIRLIKGISFFTLLCVLVSCQDEEILDWENIKEGYIVKLSSPQTESLLVVIQEINLSEELATCVPLITDTFIATESDHILKPEDSTLGSDCTILLNYQFETSKKNISTHVGVVFKKGDDNIEGIPLARKPGIKLKSPQDIRDEIAEAEDRIKRSEAGENVFFGFEEGGRAREIAKIEALKEELGQIGNIPPPAENLVTNVQPDNTAPTTNVVSGPTVVDGSVNTNNRTVAPQLITNPDPFIGGGLFSVGGL